MADCDITNAHALSGRFLITALPTIFHCTGKVKLTVLNAVCNIHVKRTSGENKVSNSKYRSELILRWRLSKILRKT